MLCYKDMTFCTAESCKNFNECGRALTKEVREAAVKWWRSGNNVPIMMFVAPPECYEEGEYVR